MTGGTANEAFGVAVVLAGSETHKLVCGDMCAFKVVMLSSRIGEKG